MVELGYALSSEEHEPNTLVDLAVAAERTGFTFALISDHFHPWIDRQGQSALVWSVLGGIARETQRLRVGTGVTCPTMRIHPAIIAQAAATTAAMMPGRFFLGLGTGENLNEHIIGAGWPAFDIRREMFEEAVSIIRQLWTGEEITHRGTHYDVEDARLYTLPDEPPRLVIAASGTAAAELAGRLGDGFIGTSPDEEVLNAFRKAGGDGPMYGQVTVCWDEDEARARRTAFEWWPNAAMKGELGQELRTPKHFEQVIDMVSEDDVAEAIVCGPDADRHIERIEEYAKAGYDHVYVHQVGPDQEGFMRFYRERVLPHFGQEATTTGGTA